MNPKIKCDEQIGWFMPIISSIVLPYANSHLYETR